LHVARKTFSKYALGDPRSDRKKSQFLAAKMRAHFPQKAAQSRGIRLALAPLNAAQTT
jgi:hypothetical protein